MSKEFQEWSSQPEEKRYTRRFFGLVKWYKLPLDLSRWGGFYRELKKLHPIQYWFRKDLAWFFSYRWYSIKQTWYYWRCRLFTPYNVIRLKDIPPTWCDKSHLLPLLMEKMIVDFVEGEKPFEVCNWDWAEEHKKAKSHLEDIYDFITRRKGAAEKEIDDLTSELFGGEPGEEVKDMLDNLNQTRSPEWEAKWERLQKLEEEFDREHSRVLHLIVDCRHFLWT